MRIPLSSRQYSRVWRHSYTVILCLPAMTSTAVSANVRGTTMAPRTPSRPIKTRELGMYLLIDT